MKWFKILVVVFMLLALPPAVGAWGWVTHREVVEVSYNALPDNVRGKLNYSMIYDGSTWPDEYRTTSDPYGRTFPSSGHIQPASRTQAEYWLELAENYYRDNDYDNASLSLGIAAHYIADSVVVVHNIGWTDLHYEFEDQGAQLTPAEPSGIQDFDLEQKLKEFHDSAQEDWQTWQNTRSQSIVQEGVDLAASYTYNSWCQALGVVPAFQSEASAQPMDSRVVAAVVTVVFLAIVAGLGVKRIRERRFGDSQAPPFQ
jgi:hypothetical protein